MMTGVRSYLHRNFGAELGLVGRAVDSESPWHILLVQKMKKPLMGEFDTVKLDGRRTSKPAIRPLAHYGLLLSCSI